MLTLQGWLQPSFLAGMAVGVAVAAIPVLLLAAIVRRAQRNFRSRYGEVMLANRRHQAIVEASGEGVLELDSAGTVRYANPAAARLLGYEIEELIGLDYRALINGRETSSSETDATRKVRYLTDIMRGVGALLLRKDGQHRPVEYKFVPVTEHGAAAGTILTFSDVTEKVRTDSLLRDMQATARVGGWEYDVETQRIHWTDAVYVIHGLPIGQPISADDIKRYIYPEDLPRLIDAAQAAIRAGTRSDLQLRIFNAHGKELFVRIIIKAQRIDHRTVRLHGTFQDITDRAMAERQLRETRDFYELTLDAMPTWVTYTNAQRIVTYANKTTGAWEGKTREAFIGLHINDAFSPEYNTATAEATAAALKGEASTITYVGNAQGKRCDWQIHFVPEVTDGGVVRGYFSMAYDITELKRLESRLLQAQKMEAIGQLTGGIAHDFNNLLGVVLGNLQLLERGVAETPSLARKVHTAMRAAVRGADLTRRLLALARRQILDPTVVDLNRQILGLGDLMQRTLGESIEVRTRLTPDLWHTRVDAGQLENAILNLAINARDAMVEGGRLTVRTENVRLDETFHAHHPHVIPGEYVCLSVSDTGCGIAPEVLQHVFEPFFTTKESGKGSGLGLAMVHGFAEQAGGVATIESTLGRGTTVRVYLPRCIAEPVEREDTIVLKDAPRGTETILVVEDDADLRETVVTALAQLGYRALAAANADSAIRILAGPERVDLLFTDIMMPGGVLGPALARHARELRPGIDVLFTTGYAENSVLASGAGVSSAELILKPYRNEDLALRIRYLLDREARVA